MSTSIVQVKHGFSTRKGGRYETYHHDGAYVWGQAKTPVGLGRHYRAALKHYTDTTTHDVVQVDECPTGTTIHYRHAAFSPTAVFFVHIEPRAGSGWSAQQIPHTEWPF